MNKEKNSSKLTDYYMETFNELQIIDSYLPNAFLSVNLHIVLYSNI